MIDVQMTVDPIELARLNKALEEAMGEGTKGMKAFLRKSTRQIANQVVLPKIKSRIPRSITGKKTLRGKAISRPPGFLHSQLRVRAARLRRRSGNVGVGIGFPDKAYVGDTYYAAFLEFGTAERYSIRTDRRRLSRLSARTLVERTSKSGVARRGRVREYKYMREPLYQSAAEAMTLHATHIRQWLDANNRNVPDAR